jgi:hypothetical protein
VIGRDMRNRTEKYIIHAQARMDAARQARIDLAKKLDSIGLKIEDVTKILTEYAEADANLDKAYEKLGRQTYQDEEDEETYIITPKKST